VARQSGLGGSYFFIILTLRGLRAIYILDPEVHNDYFLAELIQRTEAVNLQISSGFADRYVPFFGVVAHMDYHEKILFYLRPKTMFDMILDTMNIILYITVR